MAEDRIGLVTRADDGGAFHSANAAILETFKKGILRNTSVIVPGPAFEEAAEMYSGEKGLCAGLHATITSEWENPRWGPALAPEEVPSLVDERGHFLRSAQAIQERGAKTDEIIAELRAQLALARSRGLDVAYLDEHMAFGWLEGVAERIEELCRKEGLLYRARFGRRLPRPEGDFKDCVERAFAALEALRPGTYVLVGHPAYDDEEMRGVWNERHGPGQVARERDAERRMFTDPKILDLCAARGIEPVRYTEAAEG